MHYWGDDFDWEALNKAINIICFWTKLGRIGVHIKEKYGTIRCSTYMYDGSLHSICYPGYVYCQFPDWLWHLDCKIRKHMPRFFVRFIQTLQIPFITMGFYIAMKKFPHIREEICSDVDCYKLVIGGQEIHDKCWVSYPPKEEK